MEIHGAWFKTYVDKIQSLLSQLQVFMRPQSSGLGQVMPMTGT